MNRNAFMLLSALSLLVCSCKKDQHSSVLSSFHYGYYPIKEGSFWVYQVTEIIHDENAAISHDTISYQLKTEIGDTLLDNEGRIVNRFNRYKRSNPLASWVLTDVWTTVVAENRAELVEENIRRVVLRFPVKTATIWDPNQFNFLPSVQAFYEYIHKPFTVGSIQSDSTVHVVSAKELTLVSYQNQYEVYAKQIGLVKKYYKDLQISNFDTLDVSQGKELYFSLLEYGH
jgi:hypothetical protein